MQSNHDNDDYIPEAPRFCERISKEEANFVGKMTTTNELIKLGAGISKGIRQNKKPCITYSNDVHDLLSEFFELNEQDKRLKMLEFVTKNIKQEKTINEQYALITSLNNELNNMTELKEEFETQCNDYINDLNEIESKYDYEVNAHKCSVEKCWDIMNMSTEYQNEIKNLEAKIEQINNASKKKIKSYESVMDFLLVCLGILASCCGIFIYLQK